MPLFAGRAAEDQLTSVVEASAAAWTEVKRLGWIETLDNDTRPSVILDLHLVDTKRGIWGRVYTNPAYQSLPPSDHTIRFDQENNTHIFTGSSGLQDWIFGSAPAPPDPTPTAIEGGWIITRVTLKGRWRLLQGLKQANIFQPSAGQVASPGPVTIPGASDGLKTPQLAGNKSPLSFGSVALSRSVSGARSPRANPVEELHRHPMIRSADWTKSTLGAPETWPRWMQQLISIVLRDSDPTIIVWQDRSVVYNDAVIPLISSKHPFALGADAAVAFEELWSFLEPVIDEVKTTQKCRRIEAMALPMDRRGYLEETHWTFNLLPIFNEEGEAVGVIDRFSEVTASVVASRRLDQINLIGEKTGEANTLDELWRKVMDVMELHPGDTPYAVIYSIKDQHSRTPAAKQDTSDWSRFSCSLKGSVAIDVAKKPEFAAFNLSDNEHFLSKIFRQALAETKILVLKVSEDTLPEELQLAIPDRGYGDTVNAVVVYPIKPAADHAVGVLIKALNPRRPIDNDYMTFAKLMSRRIHDSFARVFLPIEERRFRAEVEQAAMEQSNLAQQLLLRTRQAEDEAAAFTKLAANAPIGMYMYDPQGFPIYINDYYFEMSGLERENFGQFTWLNGIHPDDRQSLMDYYKRLYDGKEAVTFEFRTSKPYMTTSQDGTEVAAQGWALASAFPQLDENGEVINVVGWQIDISSQKWAVGLQKERLKDALESRSQAHRFIDMVSHECRNPLSAILQSADGILASLGALEGTSLAQQQLRDAIETVQDSAQTIVLCAQHQKRIVDDILTVSKLDGNHLIITPDRADPVALVHHVLKMYDAELDSDSIKSEVVILSGYKSLGIEYVLLDPSRTLQVLINLVTNAIKFTAPSKKRTVTVQIDASRRRPTIGLNDTPFVPQRTARISPTATHPDWSTGRDLYIQFAVQDTGRGMSAEEINKLFERFAQASPRTHIKYGGSGLGLFISRQLTELQGGQIGVSSKLSAGSTFAFYILARTSADPSKTALTPVYTPGPATNGSEGANAAFPFPQVPGQTPMNAASQGPPDQGTFTTVATPRAAVSAAAPGHPPLENTKKDLHVLVVEDNLINQKVMAKQLRKLGCTVHVANHGLEALEFLKASAFGVFPPCVCTSEDPQLDLILMDIEMPVMDGLTCVREIRAMERRGELNAHVPVIAVTANARDAQQADAVKEGMDQVVTKPFRIPELVPKMQSLVAGFGRQG